MGNEGGAKTPAKKSETSLPAAADIMALDAAGWLTWLSGYRAGLNDGHKAEAAAVERMEQAAYTRAVRIVHAAASLPPVPADKQEPRSWTGAPL